MNLTKRIAWTAAVVALLAPASTVMAKDQVPLKATLTIVPTRIPDVVHYPYVTQTRFISGQVSHLGRSVGIIVQTINVLDFSFFGEFILYGASGDSITGEATGNLFPTNDPKIFDVKEDIVITGGTGRFEGATGRATGQGQAFSDTGRAVETFLGTISSPGS